MAYRKPNDLDGFINMMPKADMRVKALLAEDLVTFLSDDTNSIVCMDMGLLVDGLMPWLTGSHFKIAQKSLEAFSELIKRLGGDFNAYTATVLPHVIDRLGDNKDTVREKAQLLLQNLMEHRVLAPQTMIDKLANSCFKHKNAKVREEFLQTIVNALNEYGTSQLSVRNYILAICGLLGDPTATVRDASIQTLVEIYKHVGDRMRPDLRRIDDVPANKLAILEQKFDLVKAEGLLLKSAVQSNGNGNGNDESDNIAVAGYGAGGGGGLGLGGGGGGGGGIRERPSRIVKRAVSGAMRSKPNSITDIAASSSSSMEHAGAVTIEIFESSFEAVPQLTIFHSKDMEDIFKSIVMIINDKNSDWEKRVDSLKKIRSLLVLNFQSQQQFVLLLKDLSISFLDILKEELRSQVIREACITIAYMSKTLRNKLDQFCFSILEQLINLIQNSAKVIATSATVAVQYIVKFTHTPKLIKIVTDMLAQSKSKDIRAALCEVLCLIFQEWQTKYMERHGPLLRDTLKKSISDADNEARRHSRRAFWLFKRHFPDLADQIYGSVDIATQRALEREKDGGGLVAANANAVEEKRYTIALASRIQRSPGALQKPAAGMRSVSAVDAAAAQRAKARAQYALVARKKASNSNASNSGSLPRHRPVAAGCSRPTTAQQQQQQQQSSGNIASQRVRGRATQSQPGSRSTSPSSKLREQQHYGYYRMGQNASGAIPKKGSTSSGIPRSLANSRETSPTRGGGGVGNMMKRSMGGGQQRRTPERNNPTRTLAAARMLQQSRDAENALADALSPDGSNSGGGVVGSFDRTDYSLEYPRGSFSAGGGLVGRYGRKLLARDESDDSEASSVCSERSFDSSYTRGNNSGSRNRLDWSCTHAPFDDIETIIHYCASTHWSERKDGLISLTQYLADGKELKPQQLQCVLDMFRKMFMDTHTKVYSLFLDAVNELILAYANDLHDWLFILLTRLFNKLGTELLNSMHGKILKTLQVIHEYFPTDLQMKDVFRILSDTAQTPCTKTKIAIFKFLTKLATTYCKSSDFPSDADGSAGMHGRDGVSKAVLKIVQLAGDQKSAELRMQARLCLIALYNCNTPQMTRVLSGLPKTYQDTAKSIIEGHLRRSSTPGTNSPSSSPLSSSSPKPLQSPSTMGVAVGGGGGGGGNSGPFSSLQSQYKTSPRSRQSSVDHELLFSVDPDVDVDADVQQNIHKTSEEIRNCFGVDSSIARQYHSISTTANSNSNGYNGHPHDHHHHHHHHNQHHHNQDSCASSNSKTQSEATTESNTPESTTMRMDEHNMMMDHNHKYSTTLITSSSGGGGGGGSPAPPAINSTTSITKTSHNYKIDENGEVIFEDGTRESEIIKLACTMNGNTPIEHLQKALSNLGFCIKAGNCELPNKHFRSILKMLINLIDAESPDVIIAALRVFSKIIRNEKMQPHYMNFLELILLKIINCYPTSKLVVREIDAIIPRIVPALPLNYSMQIVKPLIATEHFPVNLCALKLLTELADRHSAELSDEHLDGFFPNLIRLAEDNQSTVRKAAVFCIVKLYIVMGEEKVKPRLSQLSPSKIRLLNIYIERERLASSGGGGSSSTKHSSASST